MSQVRVVLLVYLLQLAAACLAQDAPRTMSELLGGGAVQLDQPALQALLSGATVRGTTARGGRPMLSELTYAADGTVKGYIYTRENRVAGTWEVTDSGKLCSVLREATNFEHRACTYWLHLGNAFYSVSTDLAASLADVREVTR